MGRLAATDATFMEIHSWSFEPSRAEMIWNISLLVCSKFKTKLEKKPRGTNTPPVFSNILHCLAWPTTDHKHYTGVWLKSTALNATTSDVFPSIQSILDFSRIHIFPVSCQFGLSELRLTTYMQWVVLFSPDKLFQLLVSITFQCLFPQNVQRSLIYPMLARKELLGPVGERGLSGSSYTGGGIAALEEGARGLDSSSYGNDATAAENRDTWVFFQ